MNVMAWGDAASTRLWYRSREHQSSQFDAVAKHLPEGPQTILDVGCGYGDFTQRLPPKYFYKGIDDDERVIEAAKLLYPGFMFACGRQITDADVIVCIGAIQNELEPPKVMVREMLRHSKLLIVAVTVKKWPTEYVLSLFPRKTESVEFDDDFICIVTKGRL